MEIEYIYPDPNDDKDIKNRIKQLQKENTIGCLISGLVLLGGLFILFALLPFILAFLGWSILFLSIFIIYKAYLEEYVLNFIQKIKSRRR